MAKGTNDGFREKTPQVAKLSSNMKILQEPLEKTLCVGCTLRIHVNKKEKEREEFNLPVTITITNITINEDVNYDFLWLTSDEEGLLANYEYHQSLNSNINMNYSVTGINLIAIPWNNKEENAISVAILTENTDKCTFAKEVNHPRKGEYCKSKK